MRKIYLYQNAWMKQTSAICRHLEALAMIELAEESEAEGRFLLIVQGQE